MSEIRDYEKIQSLLDHARCQGVLVEVVIGSLKLQNEDKELSHLESISLSMEELNL